MPAEQKLITNPFFVRSLIHLGRRYWLYWAVYKVGPRGSNYLCPVTVRLSVDGRTDSPLDLGNPRPTLSWQITQIHDCYVGLRKE